MIDEHDLDLEKKILKFRHNLKGFSDYVTDAIHDGIDKEFKTEMDFLKAALDSYWEMATIYYEEEEEGKK